MSFKFLKLKHSLLAITTISGIGYYSIQNHKPIYWSYCYNKKKDDLKDILLGNFKNKNNNEIKRIMIEINLAIENYENMPYILKKIFSRIDETEFKKHMQNICDTEYFVYYIVESNNLEIIKLFDNVCKVNFNTYYSQKLIFETASDEIFEFFTKEKNIIINDKGYIEFKKIEENIIERIFEVGILNFEYGKGDIIYDLLLNKNLSEEQNNKLFQIIKDNKLEKDLFSVMNDYRNLSKNPKYLNVITKLLKENKNENIEFFAHSAYNMNYLINNNLENVLDFIIKNNNINNTNELLENIYYDIISKNEDKFFEVKEEFRYIEVKQKSKFFLPDDEEYNKLLKYLKKKNIDIKENDNDFFDSVLKRLENRIYSEYSQSMQDNFTGFSGSGSGSYQKQKSHTMCKFI